MSTISSGTYYLSNSGNYIHYNGNNKGDLSGDLQLDGSFNLILTEEKT